MSREHTDRLRGIVGRFADLEVAVIGDMIADEYIIGDTRRVSREAPVLILKYQRAEVRPGGAANAAANLRALGARPAIIGVVGDDETGRELVDGLRSMDVDVSGVLTDSNAGTVRKTRVMAGGLHTVRQQLVRIDRDGDPVQAREFEEPFYRTVASRMKRLRAVLFSDYGQGTLSPRLAERIIDLGRTEDRCLAADSRHRLPLFRGVTIACPNESEAGPAAGMSVVDEESLHTVGRRLVGSLDLRQGLVITRGRLGMSVFETGGRVTHVPLFLDCDAADVTGAGDTVAAVLTLSLAAGASMLDAALLASCAGSLVVMKRGTATVSMDEILSNLELRDEDLLP